MKINKIHRFDLTTEEEFLNIQTNFKKEIKLENSFKEEEIKLVAGVDIAYWDKADKQYGACSIIVIDYKSKEVVEKVCSYGEITIPYVAGFLAFREMPLVIEAVEKLTSEVDLFMFDGNGYLHFNNMGIATHASFFLNKPTIGVAKSYLKINKVDFEMPEDEEGKYTDIVIDKKVFGRALRTRKGVKPIFISCGNYIDIETCTKVVNEFINKESRLPIPVRLADLDTHIQREELKKL
ncbi:MAG: endonuclease V [Sarcina sp.]